MKTFKNETVKIAVLASSFLSVVMLLNATAWFQFPFWNCGISKFRNWLPRFVMVDFREALQNTRATIPKFRNPSRSDETKFQNQNGLRAAKDSDLKRPLRLSPSKILFQISCEESLSNVDSKNQTYENDGFNSSKH